MTIGASMRCASIGGRGLGTVLAVAEQEPPPPRHLAHADRIDGQRAVLADVEPQEAAVVLDALRREGVRGMAVGTG